MFTGPGNALDKNADRVGVERGGDGVDAVGHGSEVTGAAVDRGRALILSRAGAAHERIRSRLDHQVDARGGRSGTHRCQEVRLLGGVDHLPAGRVGILEVQADGAGRSEPLDQLGRRESVATLEVHRHPQRPDDSRGGGEHLLDQRSLPVVVTEHSAIV